jgi:hypothetical protein
MRTFPTTCAKRSPDTPGHDVYTVYYMGWSGVRNGELLARSAKSGFDAFVTLDSGVPFQQNVAAHAIAVVVLRAPSNDIEDLLPLVPRLLAALPSLKPRTVA